MLLLARLLAVIPRPTAAAPGDSWNRPCANPDDIMVPVGDLCVDKYEASGWSTAKGGAQYGSDGKLDYPCGSGPDGNGQACTTGGSTPIFARSVAGVKPAASLTWFQANVACANSGKHLLTNAEWQAAATGTPDPGAETASLPGCNVNGKGSSVTGANTNCLSGYGVENMVGSVWEWVADWGQYGQVSQASYVPWKDMAFTDTVWPDESYGADGTWNIAGRSYNGLEYVTGLPAALRRSGPTDWHLRIGFRCGRRR